MENKRIGAYNLKVDAQQGIVDHIVSVFGNRDLGGDIIHPGAFAKTISERAGKIRCLDQHNTDSALRILGRPLEMRELKREELPDAILQEYPEATGGLWVRTQYNLKTQNGHDVFQHIAAGDITEYSFAYDPIIHDYSTLAINGKQETCRNLRELKMYEYSPVIWGMNPATQTISAKEALRGKSLVFTDELSQARSETQLREQRWIIEDALRNVIKNVIIDKSTDNQAKLELISKNLQQYQSAIIDWYSRALASGYFAGMQSEAVMEKSLKAGRVIAKRNADRLQAAIDALQEILDEIAPEAEPEEEPMEDDACRKPRKPKSADSDTAKNSPTSQEAGPGRDDLLALIETEELILKTMEA